MKVIQILPELNSGGVERGTLEVGKYLVGRGHQSVVISNGGRMVDALEREGSRHIQLPVHRKSVFSLSQVVVLRRIFEQEQADILHLRSRVPAWLAYLAWRKMDPHTRPKLVTTVHGFNSVNAYSKIMTCGERVICVSDCIKGYVLQNYPQVTAAKLVVIHRGIDPAAFSSGYLPSAKWLEQWHNDFPATKDKFLLTLPGRITRLKGHEDLIRLLTQLPPELPFHGVIAGGAEPQKTRYLDELKALAEQHAVADRLTFTGHRTDLKEVLAISAVVLSLSQKPESFGRTTLEALSLGRPVLGYAQGGVGEILLKRFPQGQVPFGDLHTLAATLHSWYPNPPAPKAENPYTLDAMLRATLAVYAELLLSHRSRSAPSSRLASEQNSAPTHAETPHKKSHP